MATSTLMLAAALTGTSVLLGAGTADAAACTGAAVAAGASCTITGTLTLSAGTLSLTPTTSLTWTGALTGADQSIVDTVAVDQQYTVTDVTGSGAGWHVTTSATTFTNGAHTLPNATTFVTTGSVASIAATTAPTATCAGVTTCTLPTDTTTYPVALPTLATAPPTETIYDTAAATGLGQIVIGGSGTANPVGWWVNVPANASAGAYVSTITMAIVSAP